jgi:hypothetical protein
MARYIKDGNGRPGGGNGVNKDAWGKGATEGSDEGDHLQGEHGVGDTIDGMAGDDNINGFSGDDVLIGGTGADDITTGQGWDTVALGEHTAAGVEGFADDEFTGDGDDDTVNIDVNDDPPVTENEAVVDPYDLIGGYEGAVEGTGDAEGTYTTHDVIDLGGMGGSLDTLVVEDGTLNAPGTVGDVVNEISGDELEGYLWVNSNGELVFDADGTGEGGGDDDILAKLMQPTDAGINNAAVDGVTVRFEADIEVVDAVDGISGNVTGTTTQTVDYVAIWDSADGWLVSVDGGDFIA